MPAEDGEDRWDLCVMFSLKSAETATNCGCRSRLPIRPFVVIALQHFRNSGRCENCGFPLLLQEAVERKVLFPDCLEWPQLSAAGMRRGDREAPDPICPDTERNED
jgi:hypothetical protein